MSDLEFHGLEISEENVEKLQEMLGDPERRWYALRRLRGFQTAGLVAGSYWNPDLHPRGPDGQFIEKWGFVRWLVDGLWQRGRVENLLPDGAVIVRPDTSVDNVVLKTDQVYALPSPKGTLVNSPDPTSYSVPPHWEKTGEQGGSNPGGFFTSQEKIPVRSTPTVEQIQQVVFETGINTSSFDEVDYKDVKDVYAKAGVGQPDHYIAHYTRESGGQEVLFRSGGEPLTTEWQAATKAKDLKLWVTTSELDLGEARVKLTRGQDIQEGTEFYVKQTKSPDHAANEVLANELYKLAGVPVPDLYFGQHQTVASKILKSADPDGPKPQMLSKVNTNPKVLAEIRKNMAVDAWLANWDVAGMEFDNIIVVDDVPYRIDTGGSLEYRAKGGEKGSAFGNTAGELDSYTGLHPTSGGVLNPSAYHVFIDATPEDIKDGAVRVAAISPYKIKEMVAKAGLSDLLAAKLVNRRADIIKRVGIHDPYDIYAPPKLTKVEKQSIPEEQFWNPVDDQWQAGILLKSSMDARTAVTQQINNLYKGADPELVALNGDLIAVPGDDEGLTFHGLFRVTDTYNSPLLKAVSALDPDNKTEYELHATDTRVVTAEPGVEELRSRHMQYRVAVVNDQLKLNTLDTVFDIAVQNKDVTKPPVYLVPSSYGSEGDTLFKLEKGKFIFHGYEDAEGEQHRAVYRVNGTTDNSISMTNVVDGKERILTWDEWVADYEPSQWSIPDDYTQDQTLALLQRDKLIAAEDNLEAVTVTDFGEPYETPFDYPDPAVPPTDLSVLGATESMTDINGIHKDIVYGESIALDDLRALALDAIGGEKGEVVKALGDGYNQKIPESPLNEFLGQTVIISHPEAKGTIWQGRETRGIWYVEDVKFRKDTSYSGAINITPTMSLIAPNGQRASLQLRDGHEWEGQKIAIVTSLDASIPQPPMTLKGNGDLQLNGQVIGRWGKPDHYSSIYQFEIYPEFSLTGATKIIRGYGKFEQRDKVGPHIIPMLQPGGLVPKSGKTKGSKEVIMAKAVFKTRKDFESGQWVQAPDGFIGRVWEMPESGSVPGAPFFFLNRFPSSVPVQGPDGKVRVINANLLVPSEAPEVVSEAPTLKTLDEVGKMGSAPFWPLKLKDGNDPRIGQYVRAFGPGDKITEGTINWVGPPGGKQAKIAPLLSIETADGKIIRKTLSKTILLKEVEGAPAPIIAESGLPEDTKAAAEVIIGFTPEAPTDVAMPYATPDGKTLLQPQWEKDQWLAGSPLRSLTKDGYAPRIGMRVTSSQGYPMVIVGWEDVYSRPKNVSVYDLENKKTKTQQVSTLFVDHVAELGDPETGGSLEYIRGITHVPTSDGETMTENLPNGTVIYKAAANSYHSEGGEKRSIDDYFFITESGQIQDLSSSGAVSIDSSKRFLAEVAGIGSLQKVAVIDENATNYAGYTTNVGMVPSAFVFYNPGEVTHEEAMSGHFLEMTGVAVAGTEAPVPIPKENLKTALPKPADAVDLTADELVPDPPPITGVVGKVNDTPNVLPVNSVIGAGLEILDQKDEKGRGTGTEWGFGDQEYIEDMTVRAQIAKDVSTKQQYVEFHFRMLEDKAEATADRLLRAGKDATYGKWVAEPEQVRASELSVGDAISVRVSSVSDALKPSNGNAPNARVVAAPVLMGADNKGTPIYRITLATADGATGAMDVQERALPSIRRYNWDAAALASQSTTTKVSLTSKAITNGWRTVGDSIGYDYAGGSHTSSSISQDETGAKLFNGDETHLGAIAGDSSAKTKGARVQRTFPDGSYVRMNAIPSSVSGTSMGNGSSGGEARRFNEAGQVTIRVPVELGDDPATFQKAVSQAMEAVGIPPDKQAPASDKHIATFALNKLYKTHATDFHHREAAVKEPNGNDPSVVEVLKRLNKELEPILGRKVTLDDLSIHVFDDGRFSVFLSAEVAAAIGKRQGVTHYDHSGFNTIDKTVLMLGGPNPGIMGGSERFSMGIFVTGASTHRDMTKGSGDRVYLHPRTTKTPYTSNMLIFSPAAINRSLDVYWNTSDGFGSRKSVNGFLTAPGGHQSNAETMVKSKVEVSQIAYYVAGSSMDRDKIIAGLKDRGVHHINGRLVEEIVVYGSMPLSLDSPEFLALGTIPGATENEVSLAQILGVKTGAKLSEIGSEEVADVDIEIPVGGLVEAPF